MSTCKQSRAVTRHKHAAVVAPEDDRWVWGVIFFTTVALTGLCVATLFNVGIG
jgi:hypothetical protein